jgi:hypothetical protein
MRRCLIITGAVACALMANEANAKQSGPVARSNETVDQSRANLSLGPFGPTNLRSPAAVLGSSSDVFGGTAFVGRDPDRNIRFQILRDTSRF